MGGGLEYENKIWQLRTIIHVHMHKFVQTSLIPRPAPVRLHESRHRAWYLMSRARGPGKRGTCSRRVIISVGEYSCNSQTTSEGSESTPLVAFFSQPVCATDLPLKLSLH